MNKKYGKIQNCVINFNNFKNFKFKYLYIVNQRRKIKSILK